MVEHPESLIDEFLDGRLSLAELQASLELLLARDTAAAPRILSQIDDVYRKGFLPPQVHQLIKQQLAAFSADAAGAVSGAEIHQDVTKAQWKKRNAKRNDDTVAARTPGAEASSLGEMTRSPASPSGADWPKHERGGHTHEGPVGPRSWINRFLLEERLGQGGMGVVYKALDSDRVRLKDPRPHVAIKILNDDFRKHATALTALQREARRAQDLSHPNIVTVYDFSFDKTRDDLAYMTMELLDGDELSAIIEANRFGGLAPEVACSYIHDLATALAYAHKKGLVHCDFKPGNVFVTREGEIKVFDFGIARALPSSSKPGMPKDAFDAADLGAYTEAYASPEVLDGEAPVQQDDVFALGLVAYELLTGRHPFERLRADEARERKLKPPALAGVSRRRRRALTKALAFERSARQADAGEFLREFSPILVRHWAYAGVAALAVLAVYVAAIDPWIEQWLRIRSFENLPVEQQQAFNTYMAQGQIGLEIGNDGLPGALDFFSRAFEVHPYNPRAITGLEEVVERSLAIPSSDADRRANVRTFYCQEYLATYRRVVRECNALFGRDLCSEPERICNPGRSGP